MKQVFFISGTDTEVGKTFSIKTLMAIAKEQGLSTYGLKPLAAGANEANQNDDALVLQSMANVPLSYPQINPLVFHHAVAPHIAARLENRRISVDRLEGFCRGALTTPADIKFIEGAGGWRVPLNDGQFLSALPKRLDVPVILVVGMRLGCLNHALLSAEAILRDGVKLAGWLANALSPDMAYQKENIETLQSMLPAHYLGMLPYKAASRSESDYLKECAAKHVKFEALLSI